MNIGLIPRWIYQKQRGIYGRSLNYLSLQGEISYTAGDFDFEVLYEPKSKSLDFGGMEWTRSQDRFSLSATYGNGNLHVSARCEDIFHKYHKTNRQFVSGHYFENSEELIRGRTFKISVSYTFSYGKKVSRDINIDSPSESKTNVLK